MEQYYDAIIWYHLVAPFYGMCVPRRLLLFSYESAEFPLLKLLLTRLLGLQMAIRRPTGSQNISFTTLRGGFNGRPLVQ